VGARQHDTTFRCVRRPHTAARNCTRLPSASQSPSVIIIGFAHLSRKRRGWSLLLKQCACVKHSSVVSASEMIVANIPLEFFFSLPPLVSRSSAHISQLISQIGPNWTKLGWREQHSDIPNLIRIDWADSVLIKLNQLKNFKVALLLSGLPRWKAEL